MEVQKYITLLRKWAWLMILAIGLAAGSSYYFSLRLTPIYQAATTLMVGQVLENPNPSTVEFGVAAQLAQAYAVLVTQQPILQATADAVKFPGPWQVLYSEVSAPLPSGQLLQISVKDPDPRRAKLIANEIANQLILQSPTGAQQKQAEERRAFVSTQLTQLTSQIGTAQKSLNELTTQAALENDAAKLKDLSSRIEALQTKIDGWQNSYASLSALLNTNSSNFLTILTPAEEPSRPVSPNVPLNVALAAVAGLMFAIGLIFVLEFLDDTIKDSTDVERVLNLTTLGTITRMGGIRKPVDSLVTVKNPRSLNAEAYRVLRTNLRFSGIKNPSGALLVTSALPGEGKTTTAANLAITLAQTGKRVVLVDTDLRKPGVHKFFGLPNNSGLSSLFLDVELNRERERVMQPTAIEGLRVITSGPLPPNPAELLDSKQMGEIVESLRAVSDLVILDSPPALAFADASIIGSQCSGAVLVIHAGRTRSGISRRALETLAQTKVKVFGVVLNKINPRRTQVLYYPQYYARHDEGKK
jgi:capsular exopolysaccharide synthesis family protein